MKTGHSSTLKGTIWLISCPTLKKCLVKTNVVQFYYRLSSNILSHHRLNAVTVRRCATGCHWLQIFCNRMCSLTLNHLKLLRPLVVDLLKCFGMLAGGWLMTILLEYSQYRHSEYSWNTDQRSMNTACGSASWHNGNPPRPSVLPLGLDLNFCTWEPSPPVNIVTDTTNTKNSVTNVDHLSILLQGKLLPAKETDHCSGRVKKQLKASPKLIAVLPLLCIWLWFCWRCC